jgi:hypothetical protein
VEREEHIDREGDLAQVWGRAQRRRTDDIRSLFAHFKTRRQFRPSAPQLKYYPNRVASLMWKILDATRAGLRINN